MRLRIWRLTQLILRIIRHHLILAGEILFDDELLKKSIVNRVTFAVKHLLKAAISETIVVAGRTINRLRCAVLTKMSLRLGQQSF